MSEHITDAIFGLEADLAKYPEVGDPNRALVIRRVLKAAHEAGWEEGYRDGMQDGRDRRGAAE